MSKANDLEYRIPWIVFDRDQVQGFDEIIAKAEREGIQVGWSNPCFEIDVCIFWFHAGNSEFLDMLLRIWTDV